MIYPTKKLEEVAQVDWGNTSLTKRAFVSDGEFLGVSAAGGDGRISHYEYEPGTLVISAIGANCRRVFYPRERFTAIKNTIVVTPKSDILDSDYLFYALEGNQIRKRGGAQPFISKGDTENYKISVPPIDKQKKIVAKIEKQFAMIDEAARLRAEGQALADQLLPAALHEIFEKGKKKGWGEHEIKQTCILKTGATPSRARSEYFGGDIKWLVSGDIHQKEIFDCEGRITEAGMKNSNAKLLPKDCVLIALNGQGKTKGTVAILRVGATCNQSLVALIPSEKLMPEFLYYSLRFRYQEIRGLAGNDSRKGLNMKIIGSIKILLPPLAEQKEIVKKLDVLLEKSSVLIDLQSSQAADLKFLKQSILHEAFLSRKSRD